jgi:twitching motility protein PilT
MRVHGRLRPVPEYDGTESATDGLLTILTDAQRQLFEQRHDLDFTYELPGIGRFRANFLHQRHGLRAVFRVVPSRIPTLAELALPQAVFNLMRIEQGLVLVTGPTGSGKSTTLVAMIDYLNQEYDKHIVTMEDPLEFLHANKTSLVTQREVGTHTASFATALRAVLREDPDIILIGELRDVETMALAITAAETGHLVFGTLHTRTAASTVDRVIDVFPPEQQGQIRTMLAEALKGVIAQQLFSKRVIEGADKILSTLGAGQYVGEMCLLTGAKRSATVQALSNSEVIEIDQQAFMALLHEQPQMGIELMRQMSRRLEETNEELILLALEMALAQRQPQRLQPGNRRMRFVATGSFAPDKAAEVLRLVAAHTASTKHPAVLTSLLLPGRVQQALVYIFETDDPHDLIDIVAPFAGLVQWEISPAIDVNETLPIVAPEDPA